MCSPCILSKQVKGAKLRSLHASRQPHVMRSKQRLTYQSFARKIVKHSVETVCIAVLEELHGSK